MRRVNKYQNLNELLFTLRIMGNPQVHESALLISKAGGTHSEVSTGI